MTGETGDLLYNEGDQYLLVLDNSQEGVVTIRNEGWEISIHPDGTFKVNDEAVNSDDPEKGKKLYEAFCTTMGLVAQGHTYEPEDRLTDSELHFIGQMKPGQRTYTTASPHTLLGTIVYLLQKAEKDEAVRKG